MKQKNQSRNTPRIAILGAGFAGLGMAIRLRREGLSNFVIYEKAEEVGGTWRENTYPGVACDVPSHLYSFSFEPNPNWSQRFSPGAEIFDYLKHCARKYDLYRSIEFQKTVVKAEHDGTRWRLEFADGSTTLADFVISGLGGLHAPNIPDIDGLGAFSGPVFHTAEWRDDVDLSNKRVAIVGSAASAVQVIPEIVDRVAHLDVYQRTPNWVMPRDSYAYPKWVQSLFAAAPLLARAYRGLYFSYLEWRFAAFKKQESAAKKYISNIFRKQLHAQVPDDALRARLTPDYEVGCKRILISDDYFPAIARDNVDLVTDGIAAITASGVRTKDDRVFDADVIILATGFKPFDILDSIEVVGPGGGTLRDAWQGGVAAHRTVMAPGFPNFFMLLGPNSALGHNSVILMVEAQVKYLTALINEAIAAGADGDAALIEPRREAAHAFDAQTQADLQDRVWAGRCGSWYVDKNGRNYTLYPHSVRHFIRQMRRPVMEEYVIARMR